MSEKCRGVVETVLSYYTYLHKKLARFADDTAMFAVKITTEETTINILMVINFTYHHHQSAYCPSLLDEGLSQCLPVYSCFVLFRSNFLQLFLDRLSIGLAAFLCCACQSSIFLVYRLHRILATWPPDFHFCFASCSTTSVTPVIRLISSFVKWSLSDISIIALSIFQRNSHINQEQSSGIPTIT